MRTPPPCPEPRPTPIPSGVVGPTPVHAAVPCGMRRRPLPLLPSAAGTQQPQRLFPSGKQRRMPACVPIPQIPAPARAAFSSGPRRRIPIRRADSRTLHGTPPSSPPPFAGTAAPPARRANRVPRRTPQPPNPASAAVSPPHRAASGSGQDADLGTSLFAAARPHRGVSQTGLRTGVQAHGMPQTKTHAKSQPHASAAASPPYRAASRQRTGCRPRHEPLRSRTPTPRGIANRAANTSASARHAANEDTRKVAAARRTACRIGKPHVEPRGARCMSQKRSVRRRTLPAHHRRTTDQASLVADSSFFMIEKMNSAERRQSTISTLQTIHSAMPLFQR